MTHGDFRDLIEALERIERGTAEANASLKAARQDPTAAKTQAMLAELRELEKELKQINNYFRADRPDEIMDAVRAFSDALNASLATR